MEIKRVVKLQPAVNIPRRNYVVEMSFIFDPPKPRRLLTAQEQTERNQKFEHDARALFDFIRTLPIGTTQKILWLFKKELGYLTPTAEA